MLAQVRAAIVTMALFTLLLGLGYPLAMTEIAKYAFPDQAAGSLVRDQAGQVIGSSLIAQGFTKPEYLHPRPSAAGNGYDPMSSGGSNYGPLDQKLIDRVKGDAATIRKDNPGAVIPADALTTSGSGLDPDVSPANAAMQAPRIAAARHLPVAEVQAVIDTQTGQPFLGFIGQPHVNVFAVNRALDARYPVAQPAGNASKT
jgi:potassium-transporting ATPase KdpC subunit